MPDFIVRNLASGMYLANGEFEATRTEAYRFSGVEESVLENFLLGGFFSLGEFEILEYQDRIEFVHVHDSETMSTSVAASVPLGSRWRALDVTVGGKESNIVRLQGPRGVWVTIIFGWYYEKLSQGMIANPMTCTAVMLTETPRKMLTSITINVDRIDGVRAMEQALDDAIVSELTSIETSLGRR